jgi:hypothetical protein
MVMVDAGFGKDREMCGWNGAGGLQGPAMSISMVFLDKIQAKIGGPGETAAKHVLQYLKGSLHVGIMYGGNDDLIRYTDADWAADQETRSSTVGYEKLREEGFPALPINEHPLRIAMANCTLPSVWSQWAFACTSKHCLNNQLQISWSQD